MKRTSVLVFVLAACATTTAPTKSVTPVPVASIDARARDSDGDGISDDRDSCPEVPEDCDGFEDADGCPDLDNDKDSIPDTCDRCPNQPETFNGWNDRDGCPDSHAAIHAWMLDPRTELNLPLDTVHFPKDSSAVPPKFDPKHAVAFGTSKDASRYACVAQAGDDEANPEALARARAKNVCDRLVANGLKKDIVEVFAVGTKPMIVNDTEWNAGAARPRVVIVAMRAREHVIFKWNGSALEPGDRIPKPEEQEALDPSCRPGFAPPPPLPPQGGCSSLVRR